MIFIIIFLAIKKVTKVLISIEYQIPKNRIYRDAFYLFVKFKPKTNALYHRLGYLYIIKLHSILNSIVRIIIPRLN